MHINRRMMTIIVVVNLVAVPKVVSKYLMLISLRNIG